MSSFLEAREDASKALESAEQAFNFVRRRYIGGGTLRDHIPRR